DGGKANRRADVQGKLNGGDTDRALDPDRCGYRRGNERHYSTRKARTSALRGKRTVPLVGCFPITSSPTTTTPQGAPSQRITPTSARPANDGGISSKNDLNASATSLCPSA